MNPRREDAIQGSIQPETLDEKEQRQRLRQQLAEDLALMVVRQHRRGANTRPSITDADAKSAPAANHE